MAVPVFIIAAGSQHKMSGVSVTKHVGFGINSRSSKFFKGLSSIYVLS